MPGTSQLEHLTLFENLTREEMTGLLELAEPVSFEAGEVIFEEDRPEDRLYVLTSGTVEVTKEVLHDRPHHLATMEAPTVIGELGLLTEPRSAATVTAKTRVEGRAFPREPLLERLEAGDQAACKVAYQIGRTLARRMAQTNNAVGEIITHMESAEATRDFDIFQDKLIQEWSL